MSPSTATDRLLSTAEVALRTLSGGSAASRPSPAPAAPVPADPAERRLSGALMRVNHVGEVCAQALYSAQAFGTRDPQLRAEFDAAAAEEGDHLAWTRARLHELGARPSLLNPVWYAGAFALGLAASRVGDAISLGFVVETERQVERHLETHLGRLPAADTGSQAIVRQMQADEARHGAAARAAGARTLPAPVRLAMWLAAKVMTVTAHRV